MKMQASVLLEPLKPLVVEELDLEGPKQDEVLVRMAASGVCHSCLHVVDGGWKGFPMPMVLGDEGAGVVEDIGPGVTHVKPGDHVILSWSPTCGRCHYCVTGLSHLCERGVPSNGVLMDGTSRMKLRGETVYHYGPACSFSSYSVMPASVCGAHSRGYAAGGRCADRVFGDDGCGFGNQHGRGDARGEHGGVRNGRNRAQRGPGRHARAGPPDHSGGHQPR